MMGLLARPGFRMLAAALATLSFSAPSAVARAHRHGADLIVTEAKVETGPNPPYLVASPNGRAQAQHVEVTLAITNVGDRAAARSLGRVTLEGRGSELDDSVFKVGRLAAGKSHKDFLAAFNPEVRLGPLKVYVTPNWNFHVPETHYANNRHLVAEIPVIANRWNASLWSAHGVQQFGLLKLDDSETADSGFFFRFDHFDAPTSRFIYDAYGAFTDNTSYENPACIGSGSGTALHSPWSSPSSLGISYDLTQYDASLDMSGEDRFTFKITCNPGGQTSTSAKFFDPLTYANHVGPVSMSPSDTKLRGSGTLVRGASTISHHWIFTANAP
jgi:hypothetical protein